MRKNVSESSENRWGVNPHHPLQFAWKSITTVLPLLIWTWWEWQREFHSGQWALTILLKSWASSMGLKGIATLVQSNEIYVYIISWKGETEAWQKLTCKQSGSKKSTLFKLYVCYCSCQGLRRKQMPRHGLHFSYDASWRRKRAGAPLLGGNNVDQIRSRLISNDGVKRLKGDVALQFAITTRLFILQGLHLRNKALQNISAQIRTQ
jgi:hypothetical protein